MLRRITNLFSGSKKVLIALAVLASGTVMSQLSYTYAYTGTVPTLTLPSGIWGIRCWGADGGDVTAGPGGGGGKGGYSSGTLSVAISGSVLSIYVGSKGGNATGTSSLAGGGGFNGGGGGGASGRSGGGGGGATDVRLNGTAATDRIIVAGGGGGAAYYNFMASGGNGGGQTANFGNIISSANLTTVGGGGAGAIGSAPGLSPNGFITTDGTATGGGGGGNSPGLGAGQPGLGGSGGGQPGAGGVGSTGSSGGGGGGYAGGAGGTQTANVGAAGGGGSGYIGGVTSGTMIMFAQPGFTQNPDVTGNGRVIITDLCNITLAAAAASNSLRPSICAGQSLTLTTTAVGNYSWSTGATSSSLVVTPTTSTVYTLTALSSLNCTTTRTISITVNSALPVLAISNPSNSICLGKVVALTASGALTYTWANPGVVNGQTFAPTSTALYSVTGQNGCGTATAVTLVAVAPIVVSAFASPTLICAGTLATLTAVSPVLGYTWSPVNMTGSSIVVAPTANTLYTVTASNGTCIGTQTLALTTKTAPSLSASSSATMICAGKQVVLSATGANTYSWMPGNLSGSSVTVSPSTSTIFIVTGENSLNCLGTAQQFVIVNPSPTLTVTASQLVACAGQSVTLNVSGGSTYTWTGGPNAPSYSVTPAGASAYTVIGSHTSNTCTAVKTITISILVPTLTLPSNTAICEGETATLTASGANIYNWNSTSTGSVGVYNLTPQNTTTVTLIATSQSLTASCPVTHSFVVTVNTLPTLSVTAAKTKVCIGAPITLTVSGAQTYTWSNSLTTNTLAVTPTANTTYSVMGANSNGCLNTAFYLVEISPCTGISEGRFSQSQVNVYPNPNSGSFKVSAGSDVVLIMRNQLGQHIRTLVLNNANGYRATVQDLSAGLYFLSDEKNTRPAFKIVVN